MKIVFSFVLLLSGVVSQPAAGQDLSDQTNTFEQLRLVLEVGQEVKVTDEMGHAMQGKVVSMTEDQLVVSRKRFLRSRVERVFARDVTRRIDIVDSAWNGAVLGGAVAVGLVATGIKFGCTGSCDQAGSWFLGIATLAPIGIGFGGAIDSRINRTIYEGGPRKSRVVVAPWIERDRKGVLARVLF